MEMSPGNISTLTVPQSVGPSDTTTDTLEYIIGPFNERFKANLTILLSNETKLYTEICKWV